MLFTSVVTAAVVCWVGCARRRELPVPCMDYGSHEAKCLSDSGDSEASGRCMLSRVGFCQCGSQTPTDVIFLFDRNARSNSMFEFLEQREWVAEAVEDSIPPNSRVAVLAFASEVLTHLSLLSSATMSVGQRAARVRQLQQPKDDLQSATGSVLEAALDMIETQSGTQSDKVIVLLTTQSPESDARTSICELNEALSGVRVAVLLGATAYGGWDEDGVAEVLCLAKYGSDFSTQFRGINAQNWAQFVKPTINAVTCPGEVQ